MSIGDLFTRIQSDTGWDSDYEDEYDDELNPEIETIPARFARPINLSDKYLKRFSNKGLHSKIVTKYVKRMLTFTSTRFFEGIGKSHQYIPRGEIHKYSNLTCIATNIPLPDGRKIDIYLPVNLVDDFLSEEWDIYFTESAQEG